MTKKITGALAGLALLGSGAAFAGGDMQHKSDKMKDESAQIERSIPQEEQRSQEQQEGEEAFGGSGWEQASAQGSEQQQGEELSGKVVKAKRSALFIEHEDGAIVELKVNRDTELNLGEANRASDLKEGQEVRASFEVEGTENVASKLELEKGTGGSGQDESLDPEQGFEADPGLTPDEGTGGAGQEGTEPAFPEPVDPSLPSDSPQPGEQPEPWLEPGTGGSGTGGSGVIDESIEQDPALDSTMEPTQSDDELNQQGLGEQELDERTY